MGGLRRGGGQVGDLNSKFLSKVEFKNSKNKNQNFYEKRTKFTKI